MWVCEEPVLLSRVRRGADAGRAVPSGSGTVTLLAHTFSVSASDKMKENAEEKCSFVAKEAKKR